MCEIRVRTDRGFYHDSDTIHGVVFVKVHGPIAASGIHIHILGIESCMYCNLSSEDRTRVIQTSNLFLNTPKAELFSFYGAIPLGHYAFPFRIGAPTVTQSSFHESGREGPRWEADVKYFVEASLIEDETIFGRQEVLICPGSYADTPPSSVKFVTTISPIPMLRKTVLVTASLDKATYTNDEVVKLKISVQPPEKKIVIIKELEVQLLRDLTIKIDKCFDNCGDISCQCAVKDQYDISPHKGSLAVWRTNISHKNNLALKTQNIQNLLIPLHNKDLTRLPSSTKTKHINCKYMVLIKMQLEGAGACQLVVNGLQISNTYNESWLSWEEPEWTVHAKWKSGHNAINVEKDTLEAMGLL